MRTRAFLRAALAVAFVVTSCATVMIARAVAAPTLTSAASAAAGSELAVSGANWSPKQGPVFLRLGTQRPDQALQGPRVDGDSAFSTAFPVPAYAADGPNQLVICQRPGCDPAAPDGPFAAADVRIIARTLTLDPSTAAAGAVMTASGKGWNSDDGDVHLFTKDTAFCDPNLVVAVVGPVAFASGVSATVPPDAPGTYEFMAAQCIGSKVVYPAFATFTIAPTTPSSTGPTSHSVTPPFGTTLTSAAGSTPPIATSVTGATSASSVSHRFPPAGWLVATIVVALAVITTRALSRRPRHGGPAPDIRAQIAYRPSPAAAVHEVVPPARHDIRLLAHEWRSAATSKEERR